VTEGDLIHKIPSIKKYRDSILSNLSHIKLEDDYSSPYHNALMPLKRDSLIGDHKKKTKFGVLGKATEKRVPNIMLNQYRQIKSSFILGNKDRFGDPYIKTRQHVNVPGPGSYELPGAFKKSGIRSIPRHE
jgi:hypothetical protein